MALLILLSLVAAARAGSVVTERFTSATLGREWAYNVYLPTGYETSRLSYPVLYLLHGANQDEQEWVTQGQVGRIADAMIATGRIPPCLIVMPYARGSWYLDRGERVETALVEDLLTRIAARFRTIAAREGRAIAGESMGGYGALRFVLKYPDRFAAAALLSPAIYVPEPPLQSASRKAAVFQRAGAFDPTLWQNFNYPSLITTYAARNLSVPLFIAAGAEDELHIARHAATLFRLWREHDWPASLHILPGHHDFVLWRELLPQALDFVFQRLSRPVLPAGDGPVPTQHMAGR
ncbi:Prolyl oligopeptidase family serine peptidase [Rhodovastum atsumiense]|nr:alpha/beta hydrolase-fold protein [Rhodovastum atsumiense]CAH2601863.1 Prolyl oligopeptidase family serine peptidase [Rhodovastum atsumiense]